jgi:nitric oxide reductase subunit B
MIVLAVITYCLPLLTGRKLWNNMPGLLSFWLANIGMTAMTGAFAVAGITQVYLERKMGMDFLTVQKEIQIHFVGLIAAASLFTIGSILFIYNFIKFGLPSDEAIVPENTSDEALYAAKRG